MLPVPKFSLQMEDRVTLAFLSSDCHDIVKHYKFVKKGFKGMRNVSLKLVSNKLEETDIIVPKMILKMNLRKP
jgi:hypothetical protein